MLYFVVQARIRVRIKKTCNSPTHYNQNMHNSSNSTTYYGIDIQLSTIDLHLLMSIAKSHRRKAFCKLIYIFYRTDAITHIDNVRAYIRDKLNIAGEAEL